MFKARWGQPSKLSALRDKNVLTCQRGLGAYVLTSSRAHVPMCISWMHAKVPTYLASLCAHVPTCLECLCTHLLTYLATLGAHVSRSLECLESLTQSHQRKYEMNVWNLLKVNNKDTRTMPIDIVLVSLLLTSNRFQIML